MSDTGGEWQVARRRKGASRSSKSLQRLDFFKLLEDVIVFLALEQLLVAASASLSKSPADKDAEDQPERIPRTCQQLECVCYGLGPFASCVSARYQLAMLLLLLEAGQVRGDPACYTYSVSPFFSSGERDVLRDLGLTVLSENEEGKRLVEKPTFFYLMHCGKALYNNLLWKNWSARGLPLMIIIGNGFSGMRDRFFKRDYSYISKAVDFSVERKLACPSHLIDVFNDTAVITFPSNSLNGLPQSTWAASPEPQYPHSPDLEIILKETRS
uniref:SRR1 domain containing n=1 Tax=Neolamprologus brichardi TaxID=32507 RepID=A0A3Q4GDL6_NEOBR